MNKTVTISSGNSKLGNIPNVSLTPIKTCPSDAPCYRKCYAMKAYRMYEVVRKAWDTNTAMVLGSVHTRQEYFDQVRNYLFDKTPEHFRWHVAGDIPDQDYLKRMYKVARQSPGTQHLVFTKRLYLNYGHRPKNMSVRLSMWPGWGNTSRKKLPRAWCQDGTETRIPEGTPVCSGSCITCKKCWHSRGDVVLLAH